MKYYLQFFRKYFLLNIFCMLAGVLEIQAQSVRFTDTGYVNLGNNAAIRLTNFTLEAWIKIEGYGSTTNTGTGGVSGVIPIISRGRAEAESATTDINYFLGYRLSDMKLVADFEDNATSLNHPVISNGTLSTCTWIHIAATYNVTAHLWKLYINGVPDKTLDILSSFTPQASSTVNACIGSSLNTGGSERPGFFNGRIDEARIWNLARTDAQILSNYNIELASATGLAGRWSFNEGSGTVVNNSGTAGTAANGSIVNETRWVTGFNQPDPTNNASIDLNGVHDYITFGKSDGTAGNPSLNATSFTLEGWIKTEGNGVSANTGTGGVTAVPIIAKGRGESDAVANLNMNYFLGIDANRKLVADFEETTGPNHPIIGNTIIAAGVWTHVAVTYNNTTRTYKLFVNGVLDKTLVASGTNPPANTSIQHASIGTAINSTGVISGFFNGKIDEVRIWNISRTDADVSAGYKNQISSGSGLIARFGFNENCGLLAVNSISGGAKGSIRSNTITGHPTNGGPSWLSSGFSYTQAPGQALNPSPSSGAANVSTNPTICTNVSDPDGGILRVRYYGRPKPSASSGNFTVLFLPDTQFYTEEPQGNGSGGTLNGGKIAMFNAQTNWIASNRASKNIVYVGQLGDCVQNGDNPPVTNKAIEWQRAATAMSTIESAALTGLPEGIPFGISVGNHDQTPIGDPTGTTTYYNQYFGNAHFSGRSYYGGHYGSNNDNHYQLFSAGGIDFMVISFEYDSRTSFATSAVLDWAEGLVKTYSSRKVIVMTHYMLNEPVGTSTPTFGTQGQAIFNRLSPYTNVIMLHGGHQSSASGGEGLRSDLVNGRVLYSILTDYQSRTGGGNGLLRYYEFNPTANTVSAKTYSPYLNTFETDASSDFTLSMNLSSSYSLIGETSVPSGSTACVNWQGLTNNTAYEWYAEIFDGENTTTSQVFNFTTTSSLQSSLLTFSAQPQNKNVKLEWVTTNELENSHFEIERSLDGVNFKKIAGLHGSGKSSNRQNYRTFDGQPFTGKSFYRLKQVNPDNIVSYSNMVIVDIPEHPVSIDIYPNPAPGGQFRINLHNTYKGKIEVSVFDMSGKLCLHSQYKDVNNINVNHRLTPGVYMVNILTEKFSENKKLIIK